MAEPKEEQVKSSLPLAWKLLLRSSTQPSHAALLGILLVNLLFFLSCAVVITPHWLSSVDSRYLLAHDQDTLADTTHLCMRHALLES